MDKLYTMEELSDCVKSLPNNKSPGIDGISNEFYKKVFHIIGKDYLRMQNNLVSRGRINPSMRRGVIRLAPKVKETPRVDLLLCC